MIWNDKKIINQACDLARERFPDGFNIKQLRACYKEEYKKAYGNRDSHGFSQVKTEKDIIHQRNVMVNHDGRYPASISDCEVVGISGDCGWDCPVFERGECKEPQEMLQHGAPDEKRQAVLDEHYKNVTLVEA